MSKRILVTSALPYANGPIHLGHLAGAYLPADFYVRFHRLKGNDIIYICGSDEHGVPITIAAEKAGVSPQDIVDKFHERNKDVFSRFGISFDYYGRTSSKTHHETSREFFRKLLDKGVFKLKKENQLFDEKANMFLPDRYVKGTCPVCGFEEAFGDQCEKCGSSLSPLELKNPISVVSGKTPILRETEHWYLPLGDLQQDIESWLETKSFWKSNVLGQCRSWLNEGLSDRAVTRDLSWGVPVPVEGADNKVLYVWFDAPIGYISATREWAESKNNPDLWKTYWQREDTSLVHFIGKDNIVFHCIMFPAMLMCHGDYVLPENVPANEFLNLEGKKLSTSRGWAVWLEEYLESYEPDFLRYALGTTLPETRDADFSWKDFQGRVNSELADILGNFLFRTTSFTEKYFESVTPELKNPSDTDLKTLAFLDTRKSLIEEAYNSFRFREAIAATMQIARTGNAYLTETEPWKTRESNPEACANTIHVCLQLSAALSVWFSPILPDAMSHLREQLNLPADLKWDDVNKSLLSAGNPVNPGKILFTKIEDEQMEEELEKLHRRTAEPDRPSGQTGTEYLPLKGTTSFSSFMDLDLRVGEIIKADTLENSDKLLKLEVDLGFEKRTILSGIASQYTPESIIGKKVCVVANIPPKKMAGIESNGMILMAENSTGKFLFLTADAGNGSPVS